MNWVHAAVITLAVLAAWTLLAVAIAIPLGHWLKRSREAAERAEQAIGPGTKHPERGPVPPNCPPAPGHTPDGGVGSPPGPVAATSGLPDPPSGDRPVAANAPPPPGTVHVVYDVRFWSCGCTCMWDRRRRPVLKEWCEFHAHLHQWEEEMSW